MGRKKSQEEKRRKEKRRTENEIQSQQGIELLSHSGGVVRQLLLFVSVQAEGSLFLGD